MSEATLTLVSHDLCPYVQRSVITLLEKRIPHDRISIDLSAKPAWFKAISPLGKVPLLRVNGTVLFESAVICEYLEETTPGALHPLNPLEKARHRAWIEFGSSILAVIAGFYTAKDTRAFEDKRRTIAERFAWLEKHLADGPYFEGRRFHLVDAAYGPIFRYFDVFEQIDDFGFFEDAARLDEWRRALRERPAVRDAVIPDYPDRLRDFLRRRDSHLSQLIGAPG